ncbi:MULTISPECIES: 5-formyltetrahydrofolate cyclo-ligase [unclassified Methylophaga]|jgi:5-formyltetrahydrofolate cyclo-ligase|uniref:5-formyltetrahydrofolate cyclo-ligase n=1 Tax=unclassified Methylophaga TaxID=2629249 RepID=UPI000C10D830|nr:MULTISPECIES: 5-formyltetrahydrofolate cyclo-ligase [unclassified Methylophaga]MBL1458908.1 5-formyltetrahydrofolate cyclo-ligase [Methylophaga sp.]|tara:strand:+ start:459 stop:1019 length:561 start_codon:yes stop_codon:yes gene_type:complete
MTTWQEWRNKQRYRLTQQRLDIANDLRLIHQVALFDNLQTIIDPLPKGTIGFYWPVRGEIDCRDFICGLIEQGWQAALPKIIGTKEALEFRQWRPESIMQAEVWDIPVPQNTAIVEPDVLIIPLVGFDTDLHRLGNGGGFYDRTLAKPVKPFSIGIGFQWMLLDSIEAQPHDVPMDRIVTEEKIFP